jgi:hypothetical protein
LQVLSAKLVRFVLCPPGDVQSALKHAPSTCAMLALLSAASYRSLWMFCPRTRYHHFEGDVLRKALQVLDSI